MGDGWADSAHGWIDSVGERGDWGRERVLDPAMLARIDGRRFRNALDVGCGEGRFCRLLAARGITTTGIDPTAALLEAARRRDPSGDYRFGRAEQLGFDDASFDLVVSYVTLVDIADFRTAIREMARVVQPAGTVLIANLNGFASAGAEQGWVKDQAGRHLHFPVDRYLDEYPFWLAWAGIRIENWHRPLSAYMAAFLDAGLNLRFFAEPAPVSGDAARQDRARRVPWFVVMEWQKPAVA